MIAKLRENAGCNSLKCICLTYGSDDEDIRLMNTDHQINRKSQRIIFIRQLVERSGYSFFFGSFRK